MYSHRSRTRRRTVLVDLIVSMLMSTDKLAVKANRRRPLEAAPAARLFSLISTLFAGVFRWRTFRMKDRAVGSGDFRERLVTGRLLPTAHPDSGRACRFLQTCVNDAVYYTCW